MSDDHTLVSVTFFPYGAPVSSDEEESDVLFHAYMTAVPPYHEGQLVWIELKNYSKDVDVKNVPNTCFKIVKIVHAIGTEINIHGQWRMVVGMEVYVDPVEEEKGQ